MSVTLKKIADASNVSISTASRALSGHAGINGATAKRVRLVAEKMNYKVRSPPASRSSLNGVEVGILCLGMGQSLTALPAIATAISGAEAELAGEGARTVFASIPDLTNPPESLLARLPDAVILVGALQGDMLLASMSDFVGQLKELPTVWLLGRPEYGWGDVVGSNDYELGAMAARALMAAGHRRLAFVNPKPDHLLFQRREDGFRAAARRGGAASVHSLSESPRQGWALPLQMPENVEAVQNLVDEAIATEPAPTGLFAAADSVAVLIYRALATRGKKVGRDFSLVSGNHDGPLIAGLHPTLSTCDIDAFAIGEHSVRQLALRLQRGPTVPDSEIMLPPRWVSGGSLVRTRK